LHDDRAPDDDLHDDVHVDHHDDPAPHHDHPLLARPHDPAPRAAPHFHRHVDGDEHRRRDPHRHGDLHRPPDPLRHRPADPPGPTTGLPSPAHPWSVFGQPVTITATLTANSPGAGTPSGTVTFKDGPSTLRTGTLNGSGQATFTISTLAVGSHSITASYAGDANFSGSTSSPLTQTVRKAGTTTLVSSSANPPAAE